MAKRRGRGAPVGPADLSTPGAMFPKNGSRIPGKDRKAKARHRARGKARGNTQDSVRRNHKDSLFCRLFSDREYALSLYNALTGSSYTDADGLEVVTLEDAVYLSQKNDCAVCVQASLALFEQQSTWNPNMPLRGLLYFAAEYAGWLARHKVDVHSSTLVKIPSPSYFVLYNGMEKQVEKTDLRLSEAFEKPAAGYEWTAHVVNVNAGHNTGILERCPLLGEYAAFIADIRQGQAAGLPLAKAVDAAVIYCIRRGGKLAEFMRKHKAEASGMYLFGVDFEKIHWEAVEREAREAARKEMFEEGRRDGLAKGLAEAREESLRNLMDSMSWTAGQAMDALKIPAEEREKYAALLAQEA
ncbi:MAG: hypothetical protein II932_02420 [Treponema sp.]|nr:hypothetical protein [Treponema sp.]